MLGFGRDLGFGVYGPGLGERLKLGSMGLRVVTVCGCGQGARVGGFVVGKDDIRSSGGGLRFSC